MDILIAVIAFAAVTTFTPGPNNALLMASGLNFGFRRTLPHLLGVALGFGFMVAAVGLGIAQTLAAWPVLYAGLRLASLLYLAWLAWGIATSGGVADGEAGARPMSFLEACGFQWINPKAWIMAVGATTSYTLDPDTTRSSLMIASVFCLAGLLSSATWAGFGATLKHWLGDPRLVRWINMTLGLLLAASLYPVLMDVLADLKLR